MKNSFYVFIYLGFTVEIIKIRKLTTFRCPERHNRRSFKCPFKGGGVRPQDTHTHSLDKLNLWFWGLNANPEYTPVLRQLERHLRNEYRVLWPRRKVKVKRHFAWRSPKITLTSFITYFS